MIKEPNEVGIYFINTKDTLGKPDKIYYVTYKKDGKKKWVKIGRKTEGLTKAKVRNERAFLVSGQKLPPSEEKKLKAKKKLASKSTLNKTWNYYVSNHEGYKGYLKEKARFEKYIKPEFGQREPHTIKVTEVDSFKKRLQAKGLSPQSRKHILEMLRRISNYGKKKGMSKGLSFQIEFPKVNNIRDESLSNKQIANLLKVLQKHNSIEATIMRVIMLTGRRTADICGLEWKNINLSQQVMTIEDTKSGTNEKLPFSDEVKRIFSNIHPRDKKYVFPDSKGEKKTRCDRIGRNILVEAGIPSDYRPTYCLRHTFTSYSSDYGDVPLHVIQTLIGHKVKARDITARYLHIQPKVLLKHLNNVSKKILKLHKESYLKSAYGKSKK